MIYVIIGIGLLFIGIGYLVTEDNAKYLLAGYNTMSEEERKKVDLKTYIPLFRKFHLFLGISFMLIGLILNLISENAAGVFLAVYPILAYIYFFWMTHKEGQDMSGKGSTTGLIVLVAALVFVLGLLFWGFRESELRFDASQIEITGMYGEVMTPADLAGIELVMTLPEITVKTNGFALGAIRKGYFRTHQGEKVKLIINGDNAPYLQVRKKSGLRIFYTAKEKDAREVFEELKRVFPDLVIEG